MSCLYVRCRDDADLADLRRQFPEATLEAPSPFASIPAGPRTPDIPSELCSLSADLRRELILLSFSSVSDSLQFTHIADGRLLRHLQYGMRTEQGLWEEVLGAAEGWEESAFFGRGMPTPVDAQERQEMAAIFSKRRVERGLYYPMIDARESARAAAVAYRLTDWLDDWHAQPFIAAQDSVRSVARETDERKGKAWWQFSR